MEAKIIKAYAQTNKRLFLLDYDGTLADIKPIPSEAAPTPEIISTLTGLAHDSHNTVVVISGRNHTELEAWLGHLPISFAAEHGLLFKLPGQKWTLTQVVDTTWKPAIQNIMDSYVTRIPGTFIEEKTNGFVWHYRPASDQQTAEDAAQALANELQPLCELHSLRIMLGSKIVEIQPNGVSKGTGAQHWLDQGSWDFIVTAGDDTTDEDMFKIMPKEAFTIRIGPDETVATTRLPTPAAMLRLLKELREH